MSCLVIILLFAVTALSGSVVYWRYNIRQAELPRVVESARPALVWLLRADALEDATPPYSRTDLDAQYKSPSWKHPMGTDGLGRDVCLRVIQGARIAFQVGIIASTVALLIGVILGCIGGYFGGWVDDVIVWIYSSFACMPSLLFILSIALVLKKGLMGVYLGIGLTTWVRVCRLVRGEVMKHKELNYVKAARVLGLGHTRTIFRHILPNIMHLVIINFSLGFPAAIETEVIMSFLGIGVQGEPSWGIMIGNARFRLWYGVWWELTFTTLAMFAIVLAFNLFGDALRDALDPKLREGAEESETQ
jgi:peptide/nickel transport system permease protein